ncbi:MAG: delta-60 repeat domain-containing protein [Terrimicrobiaceae bacterium]|nr:delta-60 repeat domain-containing protein [Terrimicrobiaceae bacterium]
MKRIPAGILLAMFFVAVPLACRVHAEESAEQLADEILGEQTGTQDESAEDLAKQQGDAIQPASDQDQSAENLARQNGVAIQAGKDPEQSAADLARHNGLSITPGRDAEESARKLAQQDGLQNKPKKVSDASQSVFTGGEGVDGSIYAVVAMPDGGVAIGGRFTMVNGLPRSNLARIAADGTLDPKFFAESSDGVNGAVYALAVDPNGNLLVGGYFTSAQGQSLQNFVRYMTDGRIDPAFNAGQSPNGPVYAIAVQSGGRIVIAGEFSQIGSVPRRNLARFNSDSTLDAPLTSGNAGSGSVRSLAALPNGAILAGGTFEIPGQTARNILSTGGK